VIFGATMTAISAEMNALASVSIVDIYKRHVRTGASDAHYRRASRLGTLFWGIYLSAVTKTQLAAYQLAMLTSFLPSFMLSGFVYAIESMPAPIQAFSHLVSARYFVTILKGIFLKGVGLEVLWVDTLFLAAYATLVFFLATRKLKQKIV
jgi:ABC-type multidrug transport system permease subunit